VRDVTLVFHYLGGPAAVAAMGALADRVAALVAVNTFAWTPDTRLLKFGLSFMGGAPMRELDGATGFLAAATSTRFGVGRHWNTDTRRVFRHGCRMGPRTGGSPAGVTSPTYRSLRPTGDTH